MSHKVKIVQLLILISLFCITILAHGKLPATTGSSQSIKYGITSEDLSASDWNSIQAQVKAGKYKAYSDNKGGYYSSNPVHGWAIRYAADGTTTLSPRDQTTDKYQLGVKLNAIGYGTLKPLRHPKAVIAQGNTLNYQWNNELTERWINDETQLEQWFILEKRPGHVSEGRFLTLRMTLDTDLQASLDNNRIRFDNTTGTSITYSKLKVWDATGRQIPANMQLEKQQLSLQVDDRKAHYPLTIDPGFQQQAYLKASNTDSGDNFGFSVAISGNTMVIGSPHEDSNANTINGNQNNNSSPEAGAAYVFTRTGNDWKQQTYIKASLADDGYFGESVAISGDSIVIGADSGAYLFTRTGNNWKQQAHLTSPNEADFDFGIAVAISGNTVVIGAAYEDSNSTGINGDQNNNLGTDSGAAYVFKRSGNNWNLEAYLKASNAEKRDRFGTSVAISGNAIVIGAFHEDSNATGINGDQNDNSNENAGAAYIFTRNGNIWNQQAYLKASNTPENLDGLFGISVGVSGNSVVVGSSTSRGTHVFIRNGNSWSQQALLDLPFNFNSPVNSITGESVAIEDNTIVIQGHIVDRNDPTKRTGLVYIFTRQSNTWSQQDRLSASSPSDDGFGGAVAISGNTIVTGSQDDGSDATGVNGEQFDSSEPSSGAAYVFTTAIPQTVTPVAKEGLWLISSKPGSGFDIGINSNNDLYMIWYTYTLDGRPLWYLASAPLNGSDWNADLFEFTWDGNKANSKRVGDAQLNFQDASHATLSWTLDTGNGSTNIEYFVFDQGSNVSAGTWFDPGQPGYGLTQVNQGTTQVKVLYFYDQAGNPVWALGSGAATTETTTMDTFTGTCPACSYENSVASPTGTVTTSFSGQTSGVLSTDINLPLPLSGVWQIFDAPISNLSE
jgi:hypothetical protein